MNDASDRAVIDIVERSALVAGAERMRLAAAQSLNGARVLAWFARGRGEVAPRWGATLLAAAVAHVVLVAVLAPPAHLYWLALPGIAGAAGLGHLMLQGRNPGGRIG